MKLLAHAYGCGAFVVEMSPEWVKSVEDGHEHGYNVQRMAEHMRMGFLSYRNISHSIYGQDPANATLLNTVMSYNIDTHFCLVIYIKYSNGKGMTHCYAVDMDSPEDVE